MLFGHLARMDESADTRRILTAVPQSGWKGPTGRPYPSWMATIKNDLSCHNLSVENATKLALYRPISGGYWQSYALNWCKPNNDDDERSVQTILIMVAYLYLPLLYNSRIHSGFCLWHCCCSCGSRLWKKSDWEKSEKTRRLKPRYLAHYSYLQCYWQYCPLK